MQHSNRPSPFTNRQPLAGTTREIFLARIRKALDHPADHSPAPGAAPVLEESLIRQVAAPATTEARAALVDRWQKKMTENKATVHRLPPPNGNDQSAVLAALDACLAKHPTAKRALLNLQQLGEQFPIADHLRAKQFSTSEWPSPTAFADAFTADVSITDAPAGLADTGSLLVWSHANFGRSSTLVTPIHITLLPASRILPDLIDGLDFVRQQHPDGNGGGGGLPSNIVVINGPSKTADIEMKLVTGVHGPKYLYILLLDGM